MHAAGIKDLKEGLANNGFVAHLVLGVAIDLIEKQMVENPEKMKEKYGTFFVEQWSKYQGKTS